MLRFLLFWNQGDLTNIKTRLDFTFFNVVYIFIWSYSFSIKKKVILILNICCGNLALIKKIKLPLSRGGLQIPYIQSQYMVLPYIHVVHKVDIWYSVSFVLVKIAHLRLQECVPYVPIYKGYCTIASVRSIEMCHCDDLDKLYNNLGI